MAATLARIKLEMLHLLPALLQSSSLMTPDGSDLITLTGLRVDPLHPVGSGGTKLTTSNNWGCVTRGTSCENELDLHKIKIRLVVKLDNVPNASTNFTLALNTGGDFFPGPPVIIGTTAYNIVNSQIDFDAWGIFKSGDTTLNGGLGQSMTSGKSYTVKIGANAPVQKSGLMTYQYGAPVVGSSNYQLTQIKANYDNNSTTADSYPVYANCQNALFSNKCAPTITQVWVATVKGGDSFELQSSNDLVAVGCSTTNNAGGEQTPQGPPCFANSKKKDATDDIDAALAIITANNSSAAQQAGSVPGTTCEELNNCECLSDDCRGTIVVAAEVTPAVKTSCTQPNPNNTPPGFPFTGTGPNIAIPGDTPFPLPFCIETASDGKGSKQFPNLFIGNSDPWSFTANITSLLWPKPDSNHEYDSDSIDCRSVLNQPAVIDPTTGQVITPEVIVSRWTVDSGRVKITATVTELGKGDTVTCTYHIHKNSSSN